MKVTLLGHASLLVEMEGLNVLMDPVFEDPFMDGAVVSCPRREVYPERLPRIDLVFISHAHFDHFHLRSLVRLRRDVEVLCPEDPAIPYALGKLGFSRVRTLSADALVDLGGGRQLLTTFSDAPVIEVGVVFKDATGAFWNEVDTVVRPPTVDRVRDRMGHIHLLFSGYASQNVGFFETMRAGYPLGFTRSNLANVKRIGPTLVVPGSAGYRFVGGVEWANAFLFPVSREEFFRDLGRIAPQVKASQANPGDVFEIAGGGVVRHEAASLLARMIEDDTHLLAFDATAPVPALTDPNPLGYAEDVIEREVTLCLDGLASFVRDAYSTPDPLVDAYRRAEMTYAVGLVFPDGHERWLHLYFDAAAPRVVEAASALRGAVASHRVAASMLTARVRYEKSYLYYRGFSRLTQTLLGTDVDAAGAIHESDEPTDLLVYWLSHKAPGAERGLERRLDFQIATLIREGLVDG